ncbi:hypothetical protein N658DRAFT_522894 [Parathielavia hyrcaniae]|uniref:Prolyl 4-hydroxylase alpha subunit domain-containing protein n=1 Tax=Parathielavia hyrcaniae TaxID=113614 RepID=A0AAN6Q705_9PEZI|nr:hypothetical protein N658DRAFT_522894 [Parathielavia hyrcaniae]
MDTKDLLEQPPSAAESVSSLSDTGEPMSRRRVLTDICDELDEIEAAGSFASFAALKVTAVTETLGLFVHGVGDVNVPLQEEQARQLIAQSRQAPFGKGSDTVVDMSVRNTWELDASQFEFRNPKWSRFFDKCVEHVGTTLGIDSPITAELYKMLMYEKGAMFKPHTDTEKIPGMFGTLVICLPSPHEGGDLVLKHRGQSKTYKTSTNQTSMLCWYSDVHHEVLPVVSGYRWVLTYNLAIPPDLERPSAAVRRSETRDLRHALRRWLARAKADDNDTNHLYYVLDHKYTEASITFRALKTTDLARVQCLRDLSTELDFDVFLADDEDDEDDNGFDDYDDGGGDGSWHEIDDIIETSISIKKVVDLDGGQLRSKMEIDAMDLEDNLIQQCDPFEGVTDRKEDYQSYMGNSGPEATHWYRTSDPDSVGAQSIILKYAKKCIDPESRSSAQKIIRSLAETAWAPKTDSNSWPLPGCKLDPNIVHAVLQTACLLRDYDLFSNVITWAGADGVGSKSFTLIKAATVAGRLDFGQLKQSFVSCVSIAQTPLTPVSLVENLSKRSLDDLAEILMDLRPSDAETNADLEALNAELVDQSLTKLEHDIKRGHMREEDGSSIVALVSRSKDYDLFKTRLTESAISAMDITTLYDQDTFQVEQPHSYYSRAPPVTPEQRSRFITWSTLLSIFENGLAHGWDDLLMTASLKMAAQAPSIPSIAFPRLWLPFRKHLLQALPESPSPRYKQLVLALAESYLTKWVGPEPPQPSQPDLSVPGLRGCFSSCNDCSSLRFFLNARDQRVGRFQMGKKRRQHLHNILDRFLSGWAGVTITHVTDRSTYPETLVVTKVNADRGVRLRKAWDEKVEMAKRWIQEQDEEGGGRLAKLLGEADYQAVVTMEVLGRLEAQPLSNPAQPGLNFVGLTGLAPVPHGHAPAFRGVLGGGSGVASALASLAGMKRSADDAGLHVWGRPAAP